jgi:hypothetical protein
MLGHFIKVGGSLGCRHKFSRICKRFGAAAVSILRKDVTSGVGVAERLLIERVAVRVVSMSISAASYS